MVSDASKTVIFLACVLSLVPQVTSFRAKVKAMQGLEQRRGQTVSPGNKALAVFDGFIQLNNNEMFKNIGKNDSVTYDVRTEDPVRMFMPLGMGRAKIAETKWIHHVKAASITLRGTAAFDIAATSPEHVLVTVELAGTVVGVMGGDMCLFDRDDDKSAPPMLVPVPKLRSLSPGAIDYSVTKVQRAGKTVFSGDVGLFFPLAHLGADSLHKEYVLTEVLKHDTTQVTAEFPIYVKSEGFCGTELFTTPALTCSFGGDSLEDVVSKAKHLAPTNNRGFGLEFELVSRDVPDDIAEAAIDSFDSDPIPDNVEQFKHEHAMNYEDVDEYKEIVRGVQHVNYCFRQSVKSSSAKDRCSKHTECKLNGFCTKSNTCALRSACKETDSIDDKCPVRLSLWNWETDVSVALLDDDEVAAIPGADATEQQGVGMELVSPGPPNVLSGEAGIVSAAEVAGILAHQGAQAGPSQGFHVHVNALSDASPGAKLSLQGIASVWVAWAKYQIAIDEMLSPRRPDNSWSGRLFLAAGKPWENPAPDDCRTDTSTCTAMFFTKMHKYLKEHADEEVSEPSDARNFCNAMFELPGDAEPCDQRYPHQRYSQVNLMPLTRYGTIEFRPHSATMDVERIARWVQFLTAFVEYYGHTSGGLAETKGFFDSAAKADFNELREAQRMAKLSDLFKALDANVAQDSYEYFAERKWEAGDAICEAAKKATVDKGTSMLELKNDLVAKKAEAGKRQQQTPIEIMVPVPRDGY